MDTLKHTPGPWVWGDGNSGLSGKDDEPILAWEAYEGMWLSCLEDRDKANAQLIAAAPDLLECLRAVEVLFAPHCKDSTQADWLEKTQALLRRLGAA